MSPSSHRRFELMFNSFLLEHDFSKLKQWFYYDLWTNRFLDNDQIDSHLISIMRTNSKFSHFLRALISCPKNILSIPFSDEHVCADAYIIFLSTHSIFDIYSLSKLVIQSHNNSRIFMLKHLMRIRRSQPKMRHKNRWTKIFKSILSLAQQKVYRQKWTRRNDGQR